MQSSVERVQESVGVIIPARNDAAGLPRAVETVLNQRDVELSAIVIAVGPSDDETLAVAAELADQHRLIRVVDNPTGRTPEGLNLAIAAVATDVVVRVDARSELTPQYIAHALESMRETGAANVGAIQRPVGDTTTQRAVAAAMRSPFGTGGAAYRGATERKQVDTAYLGVFRRSALDEVGGYDEFFTRNQDAELNLRLNRAGHEVWLDPRLVVDYRPRATLGRVAQQYWQYGWWRQLTGRTHRGSLRLRQLVAPALVVSCIVLLLLALVHSPLWLVPIGLYGAAVVVVGMVQGSGGIGERLLMAAALATMHLAWGSGFLASLTGTLVGRVPQRSDAQESLQG